MTAFLIFNILLFAFLVWLALHLTIGLIFVVFKLLICGVSMNDIFDELLFCILIILAWPLISYMAYVEARDETRARAEWGI